jgi:hypothetical protein
VSASRPEDLYGLPLSEFTAARNKLAKESGDKSIAKLRKPSPPAWALNQAARASKGDVARFLHAAGRVRTAADREALGELRETEADVRRAALRALGPKGESQMAAVNTLLAAAATDEDVGERLRAGTLTGDEEAEQSGFVGVPVGRAKTAGRAKGAAKSSAPTRDEVREARERKRREEARQKAKAAAREADEHARRLAREAEELEDKAARARRHADDARAKAARLLEEAERA